MIPCDSGDRFAAYVKSDFDLAKDDAEQGYGDHGRRGDAQKHADHENSLFHSTSPSQVFVTQSILPVWRKFLKDYVSQMVFCHQYLVSRNLLQRLGILKRLARLCD